MRFLFETKTSDKITFFPDKITLTQFSESYIKKNVLFTSRKESPIHLHLRLRLHIWLLYNIKFLYAKPKNKFLKFSAGEEREKI